MSMYLTIKSIHMLCAALSVSGFIVQGVWMMRASPLMEHWVSRRLPHVIDTVFLGSAVALAVISAQYPLVFPWLTAKVGGLLVYIVLGAIALRRGRTLHGRVIAFFLALATYAWVVSVAVTKNPAGFLVSTGLF